MRRFASVRWTRRPAAIDRDDPRPQRHGVVDQNDVGALSRGEHAAIGEAGGARRRRRDQLPRLRQRQHAVGGEPERRQQRRRIVIVGRQHRTQPLGDHVGRAGPAGVAAAAHDIGRAEHDEVAGCGGVAGGLLVDRKFGDARRPARERPAASPGLRRHATASGHRRRARPAPAGRSTPARHGSRATTLCTRLIERLVGEAGALDHAAALLRLGEAGDGRVHVVVEGEQVDAALPPASR